METRDPDEDQSQQREEEDLEVEQGFHMSHCGVWRGGVQQKRPLQSDDGREISPMAWALIAGRPMPGGPFGPSSLLSTTRQLAA
jgi:hypothetical protein